MAIGVNVGSYIELIKLSNEITTNHKMLMALDENDEVIKDKLITEIIECHKRIQAIDLNPINLIG